jgi:hypothetical protein
MVQGVPYNWRGDTIPPGASHCGRFGGAGQPCQAWEESAWLVDCLLVGERVVEEMLFSTTTGPNSVATLTEASSMVGSSASWRIEGSGDAVSVGGELDMVGGC